MAENLNVLEGFPILMFGLAFTLKYSEVESFVGSLKDSDNREGVGMTLRQAIEGLFLTHNAGILVAEPKSLGVLHYGDRYYFTDSHSCGSRGATAGNGKACVIECTTIDQLVRYCHRAVGRRSQPLCLDYIQVEEVEQDEQANHPTEVLFEEAVELEVAPMDVRNFLHPRPNIGHAA